MAFDPNHFSTRTWRVGRDRTLALGPTGVVMGILNITPDSFSDGGLLTSKDAILEAASTLMTGGALILDVGGESTRPGADPVSPAQEQDRVLPVIEALSGLDALVSIDTYRARTAKLALEAGAHIVNDVWGFQKEPEIAGVVKKAGAGAILMHTGRERERERDVLSDQIAFLTASVKIARQAGIEDDQIVLDPGFGFAKDTDENVELLSRFAELHTFGFPLLVGSSRKRFLGAVGDIEDATCRDGITAASGVIARLAGGHIFRVHNARAQADALAIADAVIQERLKRTEPSE
ncbi:MAG: dihydropteroate synthase [Pseudomonadota bacterium]